MRVAIDVGTFTNALAVPERAITQQQATRLVLVVNDRNVVEPRPVTLGLRLGGEVLVYSGVKPGDRVIVDGLFKARPGSEVKPVPLQEGAPRGPAPEAPKEAAKPASAKK